MRVFWASCCLLTCVSLTHAEPTAAETYEDRILPVLEAHCYDCHADGMAEGSVALDEFETSEAAVADRRLWWRAYKMLQARLMPPVDHIPLSDEDKQALLRWIKLDVFRIDPEAPDPGRVTLRRLNRVEYRKTVRDLIGVDYDTEANFPPDDAGHGFDNIADVLTMSPLLLEKHIDAAKEIIARSVPTAPRTVAEQTVFGAEFLAEGEEPGGARRGGRRLSYYEPARVTAAREIEHGGTYRLIAELRANERHVNNVFDYNRCRLTFKIDGREVFQQELVRQGGKPYRLRYDLDWRPGEHEFVFELEPLTPDLDQVRSLSVSIERITLRGPLEEEHWIEPAGYRKYFPRDVPTDADEKRAYAAELLERFASRAYRRPVDDATVERLVDLASATYEDAGGAFEEGVANAMSAVLVSPRFLYRVEGVAPDADSPYPLVDEYALASRLSYFLWATMPDAELLRLAGSNTLRENLLPQVERMMADERFGAFVEQFAGQWLQTRDIERVTINARSVLRRDEKPDLEAADLRRRFRRLRRIEPAELSEEQEQELKEIRRKFFATFRKYAGKDLNGSLRRAMRRETEMHFAHVLSGDRSLSELIDCDYAFLNEQLARHYGVEGVEGDRMRRVALPVDSPRGGGAHAGRRARHHLEPEPDLAGEARPVRAREPSRHPPGAATAERPPARRRGRTQRAGGHAHAARRSSSCTGPTRSAARATTAWTRWVWRSRISTRWGSGATWIAESRSTPAGRSSRAGRSPISRN